MHKKSIIYKIREKSIIYRIYKKSIIYKIREGSIIYRIYKKSTIYKIREEGIIYYLPRWLQMRNQLHCVVKCRSMPQLSRYHTLHVTMREMRIWQHLAVFGSQISNPRTTSCSPQSRPRGGKMPHLTETNNVVQLIAHLQLPSKQYFYFIKFVSHLIYN